MTWNRIDELLGRRVSLRALALLRIAAGLVTLLHLRPFLEAARDGRIYRDSFYEPLRELVPGAARGPSTSRCSGSARPPRSRWPPG